MKPDEQKPPTVEEFRKQIAAERQATAKEIAEEWIRGLKRRDPRRMNRPVKLPDKPQLFLPGIEPRPRKRGDE